MLDYFKVMGFCSLCKIGTFFYFDPFHIFQKNQRDQTLDKSKIDGILERGERMLAVYWLVLAVLSWIMIYLFIQAVDCVRRRQETGTAEAEQNAMKAVERCVKWDKICLVIFCIEWGLNYLAGYEFTAGISFLLVLLLLVIVLIPELEKWLEKELSVEAEENEV